MTPKRILLALSLALIVSGLSTWFFSRHLTVAGASTEPVTLSYVALSRVVEPGEMLTSANTEMRVWPATVPLDGAFRSSGDVVGRVVLFPLAAGQPIIEHDLSAVGAGVGLASKIPDGLRAVALRSDAIVGVAGFLVPGSHVDVLVTYRPDNSPEPLTATVLQNALVLAAGHESEPDPASKPPDVSMVTLLLTPDQAARAVLASTQGAIHFVLRNGGDALMTAEAPVQLSQLAGRVNAGAAPMGHKAVSAVPLVVKRHEIEMVLGGSADVQSMSKTAGATGK